MLPDKQLIDVLSRKTSPSALKPGFTNINLLSALAFQSLDLVEESELVVEEDELEDSLEVDELEDFEEPPLPEDPDEPEELERASFL